MSQKSVLADVVKERSRQDALWGVQNHTPEHWLAILGEGVGETCTAVLESINIFNSPSYREEVVQIAAVAVAMVESYDRQRG